MGGDDGHPAEPGLWASGREIYLTWCEAVRHSGLPLYGAENHAWPPYFNYVAGGWPPTVFVVTHGLTHRTRWLKLETRRRSRRLTTALFEEVAGHVGGHRRGEVTITIDGEPVFAPVAFAEPRFAVAPRA
jgi:hypothetical protein